MRLDPNQKYESGARVPVQLVWEPAGVCRRYFGNVTIAECRKSLAQLCSNERFDSLRYAINDYRDVQNCETTPQATEESAALHIAPLQTNPRILLASVTTDARIVAAIEHFISLGFVSQPYRIFPTMIEARAWIEREHMATRSNLPLR